MENNSYDCKREDGSNIIYLTQEQFINSQKTLEEIEKKKEERRITDIIIEHSKGLGW